MSLEQLIAEAVDEVDADPDRFEAQIMGAEVRDLALGLRLLRKSTGAPEPAAKPVASRFPSREAAVAALSRVGLAPVALEVRRRSGATWSRPAFGWWRPITDTASGVYVLCTERHALYVGQSRRLRRRLSQHIASRPFTSALVAACPEANLDAIETRLITELRTPWNTQHLKGVSVPTFVLP